MSAVVCGKRSVFDDIHGSPPIQKRLRCGGGTSPVRFSSWRSGSPSGSPRHSSAADLADHILHLRALFPDMDEKLIEKVLESTGNILDSAIKSLNELRLSSTERNILRESLEDNATVDSQVGLTSQEDGSQAVLHSDKSYEVAAASSSEGREWVELFVQEMLSAASLEDARYRATRALEAFEKTVITRSGSMFEDLQKENAVLKEQLQGLLRDNHVLKRAVAIQHERQAEHENCSREVQQLKQLITQYQEQVRTLELNNYALNLHLRKAQEGTSMPGRFHPDIF